MMKYSQLLKFFASFVLIAAVSFSFSLAQQTRTLILAGYKAVPNVQTSAIGSATVSLKGDSLAVEGSFKNLSSYYFGAAIFYGEKGEEGNKILDLNTSIAENRTSGKIEKSKNTFELTEGQLEALSQGNLYISILSFDHKGGELRAQLPAFKIK